MKQKKYRVFGKILLVLLLAGLLTCAAVLQKLWVALAEYEASSTDHALNEYFERFADGDYETAADESGFEFTDRATRDDYIQTLRETFGSDFSELRYSERQSDRENVKIFGVYAADRALGEVSLTAREEDGKPRWTVRATVELLPDYTVTAPEFVTVSVNGVPLGDGEITERDIAVDYYEKLNGIGCNPTVKSYRFGGFLFEPTVTAQTADGFSCTVVKDEDSNHYTVTATPNEEQEALFSLLMVEFSQAYVKYIARDGSIRDVLPKMDKTTPFYKEFIGFNNIWYDRHTAYEFRDTEISEIERADELLFSGKITFDHVVTYRGKELVYPTAYRLIFRNVDGKWLLADLRVL